MQTARQLSKEAERGIESLLLFDAANRRHVRKVSTRYIMNNVAGMQKMIALKDEDVDKAQKTLMASCEEASAGILQMVREDKMQMMQQIQEHNDKLKNEIQLLEITN